MAVHDSVRISKALQYNSEDHDQLPKPRKLARLEPALGDGTYFSVDGFLGSANGNRNELTPLANNTTHINSSVPLNILQAKDQTSAGSLVLTPDSTKGWLLSGC